jgi:CubicO group peptidase (beta-lactamase class C family)
MAHREQAMSPHDLLALFKNKPLAFAPGDKYEYSASNYALLGMIIEKITNVRYETQMRESIFNTFGMTGTGFDFAHLANEHKATGYSKTRDHFYPAPVVDSGAAYAAAGMYSNVFDLYKWHKALHEYRVLPKDWQEIAFAPFKNRFALGWWIYSLQGKRFIQSTGSTAGFSCFEMRQEEDDIFIVLLENAAPAEETQRNIAYTIVKFLYDKNVKMPLAKRK